MKGDVLVFSRNLYLCGDDSDLIWDLARVFSLFSSFLVPQSFVARVFSSVFNARYSDCCVIAFCTCFLEHFCKCVAGVFKISIFLVFSRLKLVWYQDRCCTCFVVYFDDLAYFYTTQLARLCVDFGFIVFFLIVHVFLMIRYSLFMKHVRQYKGNIRRNKKTTRNI